MPHDDPDALAKWFFVFYAAGWLLVVPATLYWLARQGRRHGNPMSARELGLCLLMSPISWPSLVVGWVICRVRWRRTRREMEREYGIRLR